MTANPESANPELYTQRRRVELLRQQVFYPLDDTPDEDLLAALAEAERRLAELAQAAPASAEGGVLIDNRAAAAAGGQLMGAETTSLEVTVSLRMAQVPTGIVHLFDSETHPLVSYELKYTGGEFMRVQLTCWVEGYSAEAVDTLELTYKNRTGQANQLPTFFPQQLRAVTELTRATLHIRVANLDGGVELHRTYPLWLLARTSAYLSVRDPGADRVIDLRPYLAAWVTPNAPAVMELLRRAAELHPERRMVGYQADADGVRTQVRCIFEALKARDLTYINSLVSLGAASGAQMQRVRLPREALEYRSANCIDGTVLMASVLEFASLNPGLVLVPGHAFLAWQPSREAGDWDFLETTLIGSGDFEAANRRGRILAEHYRAIAQQTGRADEFYLLPLAEARTKYGILPME
jgi:hypothetical protein